MSEQTKIQKAYAFNPLGPGPRGPRLAGVTPRDEIEPAVLAIVEQWNVRIPCNHVRVITESRFREARHTLEVFAVDQVLAAIDCYGSQDWQRQRGAWKRFENFITLDVVTAWYESAVELAEKRSRAARTKQRLQKQIDDAQAADRHRCDLVRQFEGLSAMDRASWLVKAKADLAKRLGPGRKPTDHTVKVRAAELMEADQCQR